MHIEDRVSGKCISLTDMRPALDYSEEARKLWSKLG